MLELTSTADRTYFVSPQHVVSVGSTENNDPRHTRLVLVTGEVLEMKGNFRDLAQKLAQALGQTIARGN